MNRGNKKRISSNISGLVYRWRDKNPMALDSEITNIELTCNSKNPIKKMMAEKIWRELRAHITGKPRRWKICMAVIFSAKNRNGCPLKIEEYEFIPDRPIAISAEMARVTGYPHGEDDEQMINNEIAHHLNECLENNAAVPDGHKSKGEYLHCEFSAEVLG